MNRMKWIFLLAIGISTGLSSCFLDSDCINGEGPNVTQELILDDFTGVALSGSADVFIKQGPEQKVTVEGRQNIIDDLELDVRNGIWDIDNKSCIRNDGNMKVFIELPEINALHISGSGNMVSENIMDVDDLDISIAGSGDMILAFTANLVDVRVSGSGNISLEGTANELRYDVSGSGDLRAFDLEANTANIKISGSGNAEVRGDRPTRCGDPW